MHILEALKQSRAETLEYFDLSDKYLERSYAPNKWCVKEILHHLADAESVLYDRIRRVISEPRQVIWSFNQDLWAQNLNYKTLPLALNRMVYRSVRDMVIVLAEQHYEEHGQLEFVHSETGVKTLKEEFDKIAWHNENHLKQIRIAIDK
jgi:hypothetical protein